MNLKSRRYFKFIGVCVLLVPFLLIVSRTGVPCPTNDSDSAEIKHSSELEEVSSAPSEYKSAIPTSIPKPLTRKVTARIGGKSKSSAELQALVKILHLQVTPKTRLQQDENMHQFKQGMLHGNSLELIGKKFNKISQPLADYELQLEDDEEEHFQKDNAQKGDKDYPNFVIQKFIRPHLSKRPWYTAKRQQSKLQSQERQYMRLVTKYNRVESGPSAVKQEPKHYWNEGDIERPLLTISTALSQEWNCSAFPCPNYLTPDDLFNYESCHKKKSSFSLDRGSPWTTNCHFRRYYTANKYHRVALLSSPGAGIDQFRRLLELVTGICTGSVECDKDLKSMGMAGESVTSTAVLLVKMDAQRDDWWASPGNSNSDDGKGSFVCDLVVFLYRNPYKSIMQEWFKRERSGSKDSTVGWTEFVASQVEVWERSFNNSVLLKAHVPVHLVKYENLQNDIEVQVRDVLTFLDLSPTPSLPTGLTWGTKLAQRERTKQFDSHHRELVNSAIRRVAQELSGKHRYADSIEVVSYISTGL